MADLTPADVAKARALLNMQRTSWCGCPDCETSPAERIAEIREDAAAEAIMGRGGC